MDYSLPVLIIVYLLILLSLVASEIDATGTTQPAAPIPDFGFQL